MDKEELLQVLYIMKNKMKDQGYNSNTPQAIVYIEDKKVSFKKGETNIAQIDTCNVVTQPVILNTPKSIQYSPTYIRDMFYDKPVQVLVDTGASLSLINAEIWTRSMKKTRKESSRYLGLEVSWRRHLTCQRNDINISIANFKLKMPVAIVEKLSKSIIMRVDVLDKTEAEINVSKRLTFKRIYPVTLDVAAAEVIVVEEIITATPTTEEEETQSTKNNQKNNVNTEEEEGEPPELTTDEENNKDNTEEHYYYDLECFKITID